MSYANMHAELNACMAKWLGASMRMLGASMRKRLGASMRMLGASLGVGSFPKAPKRAPVLAHGAPWGTMGHHGVPWGTMGYHGVPWGTMG